MSKFLEEGRNGIEPDSGNLKRYGKGENKFLALWYDIKDFGCAFYDVFCLYADSVETEIPVSFGEY